MQKQTHESNPVKTEGIKAAPIVKELDPVKETKVTVKLPIIIVALSIVAAGVFTGYVLAQGRKGGGISLITGGTTSGGIKKVVGVQDEKTYKDSVAGVLREGGIAGEGSHHLERPGGPSQDVYLTSSTISFDDYVGKQVKVWGETFAAKKAGWFMDVGRLELLE